MGQLLMRFCRHDLAHRDLVGASTHFLTIAPLVAVLTLAVVACDDAPDELTDEDSPPHLREMAEDPDWAFQSTLRKGQPGAKVGQVDYCRDPLNPCTIGEGNCVNDSNCQPGLVCAPDTGARYSLGGGVDVCVPPHCVNNAHDPDDGESGTDCGGPCGACERPPEFNNGSFLFCSPQFPCAAGQGHCDNGTRPCMPSLTCTPDAGAGYGLAASADVCVANHCNNATLDGNETGTDCGGSCPPCPSPRPDDLTLGTTKYCSAQYPCDIGEGHCDGAARPCSPGLVCGNGNGQRFGFRYLDRNACVPAHCLNGVRDEASGETDIDCGGNCGACARPTTLTNGTNIYCSSLFPCGHGEGNCRGDADCQSGTKCNPDTGASFGLKSTVDVCMTPACIPESDAEYCARVSRECGPHTGTDNCGEPRDVTSCGSCTTGSSCNSQGTCDPHWPVSIAAGLNFSCGLRDDDTTACWGQSAYVNVTPGSTNKFRAIAGKHNWMCAIRTNSALACWGSNANGQLNAPTGSFDTLSAHVGPLVFYNAATNGSGVSWWGAQTSTPAKTPPAGVGFKFVAPGQNHSCGIALDDTIRCWGTNTAGQATAPTGTFLAVGSGEAFSCGLRTNGNLTCWGSGTDGRTTPPTGTHLSLSVSGQHACAIRTSDRAAKCWGTNTSKQTSAPSGTFREVAAGFSNSCGIKTDGSVACWGANEYNQSTPPAGLTLRH